MSRCPTCGQEVPERTCRICGDPIPEDRHPNAVTCSEPCAAKNDREKRRRANRNWYRRQQEAGRKATAA